MKIFYDEIIQIGELMTHIQSLEIDTQEKEELAQMVDETVHHEVMSVILTHLPQEHHEEFLERFGARPHDESLLQYLKAKVEDIEDKLKDKGTELREKFKAMLQSKDK